MILLRPTQSKHMNELIAAVVSHVELVANTKEQPVAPGPPSIFVQTKTYIFLLHHRRIWKRNCLYWLKNESNSWKMKVFVKLISAKTLTLNDVHHVPNIRTNLVFVALLNRVGRKGSFETNKIVLKKNNIFLEKGLCYTFVLNTFDNITTSTCSLIQLSLYVYDMKPQGI